MGITVDRSSGGGGVSDSGGFSGKSASDINSMSDSQFSNCAAHSSLNELANVALNPSVSKDKQMAALSALEAAIPPPKPDPNNNSIGGDDEAPEDKLKKLLAKLKEKLANGGSMSSQDTKDLQEAVKAVADSQSTQGASTKS